MFLQILREMKERVILSRKCSIYICILKLCLPVRRVENVWEGGSRRGGGERVSADVSDGYVVAGASWSNYEWFNLIFCMLWNITVSYIETNGINKHVFYRLALHNSIAVIKSTTTVK